MADPLKKGDGRRIVPAAARGGYYPQRRYSCARQLANRRYSVGDNGSVTQAITIDPEIMHGVPVFRGTRVPVQVLFDYLEGGETLDEFLRGFPTVSRAQALDALEEARQLLLSRAS